METDCFECYYCGQCSCSTGCEYCDDVIDIRTDEEITGIVESMRDEYRKVFYTYTKDFE